MKSELVIEKVIENVSKSCSSDPNRANRIRQCLQDQKSDEFIVLSAAISALLDVISDLAKRDAVNA